MSSLRTVDAIFSTSNGDVFSYYDRGIWSQKLMSFKVDRRVSFLQCSNNKGLPCTAVRQAELRISLFTEEQEFLESYRPIGYRRLLLNIYRRECQTTDTSTREVRWKIVWYSTTRVVWYQLNYHREQLWFRIVFSLHGVMILVSTSAF